jgi:hypothetical protein
MKKVPEDTVVLARAGTEIKDLVPDKNVQVPEKIAGRWENSSTKFNQTFSMENIIVNGEILTGKLTQYHHDGCVTRDLAISGKIKNGVVNFDFTPPCYPTMTVVLDFDSKSGTYQFGSNSPIGTYSFK